MRYRVALVALYFSVPALAQSVPPAQAQGATTVDAETIEGVGDLEVTARGKAEIRRDDVTIFGELLRYNAEFGRVQGEGGVRLRGRNALRKGWHREIQCQQSDSVPH